MAEPTIRFPVTCPQCGNDLLTEFPVAQIAAALLEFTEIRLYASCHEQVWEASPLEVQQIREYLGAPWIDAQRT